MGLLVRASVPASPKTHRLVRARDNGTEHTLAKYGVSVAAPVNVNVAGWRHLPPTLPDPMPTFPPTGPRDRGPLYCVQAATNPYVKNRPTLFRPCAHACALHSTELPNGSLLSPAPPSARRPGEPPTKRSRLTFLIPVRYSRRVKQWPLYVNPYPDCLR